MKAAGALYVRLAEADTIEEMSSNMYLVDGKACYLQLDDTAGARPVVRSCEGRQELIISLREKLSYTILF